MGIHQLWTRLSSGLLAALMVCSLPFSQMQVLAANGENISGDFSMTSEASVEEIASIVGDATLETGALDPEIIDISVAAGKNIDEQAVVNESHVGNITGEFYGSHDYSAYVSPTLKSRLSSNERALYDAYDALLSTYLNSSNVDATKYTTSSYSYYVTSSINFAEYGLDKQKAFAVAQLFLYNNPQYYFASSVFLTTSSSLWFTIYDDFANGSARAKVTDELFTTLDNWIATCSSGATTYIMERTAHNMLRDYTEYISGRYDQSIYSTLIQNKTVCAGYSEVFTMMMNAMGIDTMTVLSDSHAWNVIRLDDNKYYAVDVTWDDSLGDYYFFNVSEENLKRFDTSTREHIVAASWSSNWVPAISTTDYVPSYYDSTGTHPAGTIALDAPYDLYATYDTSDDSVKMVWSDVPGAASYEIQAYNYNTGNMIGSMNVVLNHIKITNVNGRNLVIKIRTVGVNDGTKYYSEWSQVNYVNGNFIVRNDNSDVVLSAPTGFEVTDVTDSTIDLGWNTVANASGYAIYLYRDPNKTTQVATLNASGTSVHITGYSRDMTLYAYVRAYRYVSGKTTYSDWTSLVINPTDGSASSSEPEVELGAPTGVAYTKSSATAARVTWTMGSAAKSTNVVIRLNSENGTQVGSLNTSGTVFNITGIKSSKTYYVCLQSVGADGSVSDWTYLRIKYGSSESSSGQSGSTGKTDNSQTMITAPAQVSVEKVDNGSGRAVWSSVSGASSYDVEISKSSDFAATIAKISIPGTALRINGINAGTTYYVRVRAVGSNGTTSAWTSCSYKNGSSSATNGNTSGNSGSSSQQTQATTVPTNIKVVSTDSKTRLMWDVVSSAVSYNVEIYNDSACTVKVASLSLPGTSVTINGMKSGRTYYFRVQSVMTNGTKSEWAKYSYTKQ